ncbi:MAG: hypothetical protein AAGG01_04470 [Planctomycetota bacterium]
MLLVSLAVASLASLHPSLRPPTHVPFSRTQLVSDVPSEESPADESCPLEVVKELLSKGTLRSREEAVDLLLTLVPDAPAAWLLGALADADPRVADGAQEAFPLLPGDVTAAALLGRDGLQSRDPTLRLRCAETLGRLNVAVDGRALLKHVSVRNVELSRMLLWSVERLAKRDLLSGKRRRIIKAVRLLTGRGDNDRMRAAAMQALSILAPRDSAISMDNLDEGTGPETAAALMDTVVALRPSTMMALLRAGVVHSNPLVRLRAIDMIRSVGMNRDELDLLVTRLDDEPRAAIRTRIHRLLQYMTGHPAEPDAILWRQFAKGLSPSWNAGWTTNAIPESDRVIGGLYRLEELQPFSDRIAILVDVSAPLWKATKSGGMTADLVLAEAAELLTRIDQTASFLMVPFASEVIPVSLGPIDATPKNVRSAASYLTEDLPSSVNRDQGSNISAALDYALGFPEIDRVVVISVASEYEGAHVDPSLLARLYREKTRFRPAIFDFVLINASESSLQAWASLTSARAGRFFLLNAW